MRARNAASGIAVVVSALSSHRTRSRITASRRTSTRASRSASRARSPSTRRAIRTATSTSPPWTRTAGRASTSASRTASRSSRATGSRRRCSRSGTKVRVTGSLSRHSPYMCFFDTVEFADGRKLSVNGPTGPRAGDGGAARPRKDIFGTWLLAPIAEPQHQRPAADDPVADAGRREGRRRLRSVQGRSDVPLRSGRHPPRVGRAGHAARDRARRRQRRAAPRVDGRAPRHPHEHEGASEERSAQLARPLDRPHGKATRW